MGDYTSSMKRIPGLVFVLLALVGCATAERKTESWRDSITLHASFDGTLDAGVARGDAKLYSAESLKQAAAAVPGLGALSHVALAPGAGRNGSGALHFKRKGNGIVCFQVAENLNYRTSNWDGTVAFWLRTDPARDLAPGYCDPVQITAHEWNDAAFFVEFEKRTNSIPFRLGVYPNFAVWNPDRRDWNKIPMAEKPLLTVDTPPFSGERWTHVIFTFANFNTGRPDGTARLYLDGKLQGEIGPRRQTFAWDPKQARIMLGLGYIGFLDELTIFSRALDAGEISEFHRSTRVTPPTALRSQAGH
jgi:hypothetical protein